MASNLDCKGILINGGRFGIGFLAAAGALNQCAQVTIARRFEEKLNQARALLDRPMEMQKLGVASISDVEGYIVDARIFDHVGDRCSMHTWTAFCR